MRRKGKSQPGALVKEDLSQNPRGRGFNGTVASQKGFVPFVRSYGKDAALFRNGRST
jgi:hypothetical protein